MENSEHEEHLAHSSEVAKGTIWGLAGTFVTKIVAFLYTIYMAYVISQGDVGVFNLALGIVAIISVWKDLGLPTSLLRYVPYYEGRGEERKASQLLKNAYIADAISGVVLTAVVWLSSDVVASFYSNPALGNALRLMSFFVLIDNLYRVGSSYLNGKARIADVQLLTMVQSVAKLILTVIIVNAMGANYASLTIAYVASSFIGLIVMLPMVLKESAFSWRNASEGKGEGISMGEMYREIAPFGIMLMAVQTFYTVISSTDKAILGYLAPTAVANEQVAIYSMAVTLGGNLMVFPGAVGGIFLPVISRLVGKGDTAMMRRTMGTAQRWTLFITIPMAAVMIAFSSEMLSVFFGSAYGTGGATMAIFMAGLLFSVISYTSNLALAGMRLIKLELKIVAFAAILNVALNLALIPGYGMEGAAFAGAVSLAVSGLLFMHYNRKMTGFDTMAKSGKLLLAGVIVLGAAFAIKPAVAFAALAVPAIGPAALKPYLAKIGYLAVLGITSCLAFAAFGTLSVLMHCFEKEDATVMRGIAKKAFVPERAVAFVEKIIKQGTAVEK